jgi:MoaA/NifB/PqqE/SkfB family radical SAM enzyme
MRARIAAGLALARDWVVPGEAIAQWTHFVTSVCNARCAHCFYPINAGKNELTLEEIDRFASTLPPIRLLLISGGEPFLRRDLPEVIRVYFERCGFFNASIPTNGFSADEVARGSKRICGFSPDLSLGVTVSIDGFREFHDRVRAVAGLYDRALETLAALLDLSRSTPNLTVGVTTVFMRDNQKEVEEFCEFIYERFRPNHHALGFVRGNPFDPRVKEDLDVDLYERLSRKIDSRYPPDDARTGWKGARTRARREVNRRRFEYIARQARGGEFEEFCLAGEREYVLTEEGNVHGCELISTVIGNVRDAGFEWARIRGSEAARRFVEDKHDRLCRCTHECNARTMILFNRSNALPVLAAMAGIEARRPS